MRNTILGAFFMLLVLTPSILFGQKDLTLDDAVMGRYGKLATERLSGLSWISETNSYTYVETIDNIQYLILVDASTFEKSEIIDTKKLASLLLEKKALKRLPRFKWISRTEAYFKHDGVMFLFDRSSNTIKKLYEFPKDGAMHEFVKETKIIIVRK